MSTVSAVQLRNEAERLIVQATGILIQAFPGYQAGPFERGASWTRSIVASQGTAVEFLWEVRDKHYIKLAPCEQPSDTPDQGYRVLHGLELRSKYGIERLVKYGGGSGSYLLYRSNPVLGIQELVRRVPDLLEGDWSRRAEIERADG